MDDRLSLGFASELLPEFSPTRAAAQARIAAVRPAAYADTQATSVFVANFHRAWPWSERRWIFVDSRLAGLASKRWHGEANTLSAALQGARRVRSVSELHLDRWLARGAGCEAAPALLQAVGRRCDSPSQEWSCALRGLSSAADLLALQQRPAT